MWVHLAALVLAPLLAALGAGAAAALPRAEEVRHLRAAEALLHDTALYDDLRRAVDQELLPTVVLSVLRDDARSQDALLTGGLRTELLEDDERRLRDARARTDGALARVAATSTSLPTARQVADLRAAADAGRLAPGLLTQSFLATSDELVVAERTAAVRAGAASTSSATAMAVSDVSQLGELTSLASRQLPLLFATLVSTGKERQDLRVAWRAAAGAFDRASDTAASLSDPHLREGVHAVSTYGATAQLATRLSSPNALDGTGVGALVPGQVLDLVPPSAARDAALAQLLQDAVATATTSATAERVSAQEELRLTTALVVGAVLLAVGATAAAGRALARSLGRLQLVADQARDGHPVVVPDRGPREVRRAAAALAHAATGLHRVRVQLEAVTRGDLAAASAQHASAGGLEEAVHRSLQEVVRTVEANEALRAELAVRASTDALTGLPNRVAAVAALAALCEGPSEPGAPGALVFLDLDGFKAVNDSLGHAAGDEVLRATARRLLATVRAGDVVGRLGGDEFVVVASGADAAAATELAQRLVEAVAPPVPVGGGRTARIGASAGVALASAGPCDAEQLLGEADAAVYRAKAAGRGCVQVAGSTGPAATTTRPAATSAASAATSTGPARGAG
ncbi:GGDEF domain-containing protein [Quadrisphaera setariae]|uniref:Diguanylate cyclase n=1 Tax=Quadrisphaera setariae TaxID=2593304 RepID=A0A5C8ZM87_9ACTN|nr:GGDEF domain-containing protein [Quadrisphaera setariae]TXR58168.1 diguanylate cyclase [Quadrisphaera setariae]